MDVGFMMSMILNCWGSVYEEDKLYNTVLYFQTAKSVLPNPTITPMERITNIHGKQPCEPRKKLPIMQKPPKDNYHTYRKLDSSVETISPWVNIMVVSLAIQYVLYSIMFSCFYQSLIFLSVKYQTNGQCFPLYQCILEPTVFMLETKVLPSYKEVNNSVTSFTNIHS